MKNNRQKSVSTIIASSALAILALLAGLYFGSAPHKPLPELITVTLYPTEFRKLEDFALSDQHGQTFTLANLKGAWSILFFGYTYCPDIYPTTLYLLNQVDTLLADSTVRTVFVSVDASRDTPERMQEYVGYFNPDFMGITGNIEQIEPLAKTLGVYYQKQASTDGVTYLVNHSAGSFLINPEGKPQALFSAPHKAENIAHDIQLIIQYYGERHA